MLGVIYGKLLDLRRVALSPLLLIINSQQGTCDVIIPSTALAFLHRRTSPMLVYPGVLMSVVVVTFDSYKYLFKK